MAYIYIIYVIYIYIYLFWRHSIWHSFWHILWHSIWHLFWHSIWHSAWHIFWNCIRHLFWLWRSIWHLSWSSSWHSIWHSMCTHNWGPAVPAEIWLSQLRSGSAHWALALAVAVRQCPLRSGARGWGSPAPTEIWSSFEELEDEKEKEKEEEGCIKSRDPHLAGGEKVLKSESMSKRWRQWLALNVWLVQNCSSRFKPLELFSYKVAEDQPRELNLDFGYRSWRLRRALRYATV